MKRFLLSLIVVTFSLATDLSANTQKQSTTTHNDIAQSKLATLQIPFIENQGQLNKKVSFYSNTFAGSVFVTKDGELVYALPQAKINDTTKAGKETYNSIVFSEMLVGARKPNLIGINKSPTIVNIYHGDKSTWRKHIAAYDTVSFGQVYPGIELKLNAHGNNIEKLFYVSPKGNVANIRLHLDSARRLRIDDAGRLIVTTVNGSASFTAPVAYQENNGDRTSVDVAYVIKGNQYGFKVGDYDKSRELIIDPLLASTYLGGSNNDLIYAFGMSGNNVVVAGHTMSLDFPDAGGSDTNGDVMVAMLDPDLSNLMFVTLFGGSSTDTATDMVMTAGTVYLSGITTSNDFPLLGSGYSSTGTSFVARLNSDLVPNTTTRFPAIINACDLDATGNVFIAGFTDGALPGTDANTPMDPDDDGFQTSLIGGYDGFIAKLSSGLDTLQVATYLGGTEASSEADSISSIAIDETGDIYVAGMTTAADFPMGMLPGYDEEYAHTQGDNYWDDIFVTRLSNDLHLLAASTYLGGLKQDNLGTGLNFDTLIVKNNFIYVAGETESGDFPVTHTYGPVAAKDAFVTKLNANLSDIEGSIRIGGSSGDGIADIAVEIHDIFVTGTTYSVDYPTTPNAFMTNPPSYYSGGFVTNFDIDTLSLKSSTLIAGLFEQPDGIAVDLIGNVFIGGYISYDGYPTTATAHTKNSVGNADIFVSRFTADLSTGQLSASPSDIYFGNVNVGDTADQNIDVTNSRLTAVTISNIGFMAGSSTDFSQTNDCGNSIAGLGDCTITVTFTPSDAATVSGILEINSNDAVSPHIEINISGTGETLLVAPSSLDFGLVDINILAYPQNVFLTNTTSSGISITGITLDGSSDFNLTDNCVSLLPAGEECYITVDFLPSTQGDITAKIVITTDIGSTPIEVPITGYGSGPVIKVEPSSLTLQSSPGGIDTKALSISNTGDLSLSIIDYELWGEDILQFSVASLDCDLPIVSNYSCTITVNYHPQVMADPTHSAYLIITSDDPVNPNYRVNIEGTGFAVEPAGSSCTFNIASYGSYLNDDLPILREFRDKYMQTNYIGKKLVSMYYQYSPPVADYIRENETRRTVARWLLTPVVYTFKYPYQALLIILCINLIVVRHRQRVKKMKIRSQPIGPDSITSNK